MVESPLLGHRWILSADGSGAELFRQKESRFNDFVTPTLFDGRVLVNSKAFYASKQESAIWLTLFCDQRTEPALLRYVASHQPRKASVERVALALRDPLLAPTAGIYRSQLKLATRFALDLHPRHGLVAHQCALIRIASRNQDPRRELDTYLFAHSPYYKAYPAEDRAAFWSDFLSPGPSGLSPYGHWIWNIVLGVDAHPNRWPPPATTEAFIGINCGST